MKKINACLAICLLCFSMLETRSQNDTLSKNKKKGTYEAGFNLASMTLRPGNFYTRYKLVMDNQAFSGLYLKYHIGKNALRWELNFSQRNLRYNAGYMGSLYKSQSTTKSLELKMGYQRSFWQKRWSFYYFADLEYNHFWGNYANYYPLAYEYSIAPYPYYNPGSYSMSGSMLSISPGIGLRWQLGKHLALGMETNAQLFLARERGNYYLPGNTGNVMGVSVKVAKFNVGFIF